MKIDKYIIITFFILFSIGIFISTCTESALSQAGEMNQTTNNSVYGVINGHIIDEQGNPVSNANVTLWQNGNIWHGIFIYYPSDNPQKSNLYGNDEGSFKFGFVDPGAYLITAEKEGYSGSASVLVRENNTNVKKYGRVDAINIVVNVTLDNYHVPPPSPTVYSGTINGSIKDRSGQYLSSVNVSLWQNGSLLNIPENPQMANRFYSFDHLAHGQYEIQAYMLHFEQFPANQSVVLSDNSVTSDIVLPFYWTQVAPTPKPIDTATPSPIPQNTSTISPSFSSLSSPSPTPSPLSITQTPAQSITPMPFFGLPDIFLSILFVMIYVRYVKKI